MIILQGHKVHCRKKTKQAPSVKGKTKNVSSNETCYDHLLFSQVSGKLQPKLTGLGSIQFESASSCKTMSGLSHFAPEVFSRRPYRWSSDVYSFGIACWEMWFGRKAFLEDDLKTHSPIEFASKLFAGYRPTIEDSFRKPPDKLWKEMQCCLECQFEKRPNIEKVESTLHGMSH